MNLPCRVAGLVGSQIGREISDFIRLTQTSHWLTADEGGAHLLFRTPGIESLDPDPLIKRRSLHRSRTNRVATDSSADEVRGDRFRQADDGGFCYTIGKPVRHPFHARGHGGHIDDRSATTRQHAREKRLDEAVHGPNVQVERKIPILLRTLKNGSSVDKPGAIEKHIDRSGFKTESLNRVWISNIESARDNIRNIG